MEEVRMHRLRHSIGIFFALSAVLPAICRSEITYLKEMPKNREIPHGQVVYVDDGKCEKDEVKEVTGGSVEKSIRRKVRCVKRPDSSFPR